MINDAYLPQAFQVIRDKDEKFLWVGMPARAPFLVSGIPFLVFGCLWGAFDYFFFIRHMGGRNGIPLAFGIPFFALHLMPFWGAIINMARLFFVVGNTYYAVTPKRIMMRSGFWGTDFKTMDFDQVGSLEVSVNPIENALGVGSIRFYPKLLGVGTTRTPLGASFIGVANPYEVFKLIKQVHDKYLPAVA
jgi:hypothetical protein